MSYTIEVKEEWYKDANGALKSRWDWFVYDNEYQLLDQGSAPWSEGDAKQRAERAATLHYRQEKKRMCWMKW